MLWSLKSDRIAFFSGGQIIIADTFGVVLQKVDIQGVPLQAVWNDDSTILVRTRTRIHSEKFNTDQLFLVPLIGDQQLLEVEKRNWADRKKTDHVSFEGPFLSMEGRSYYVRHQNGEAITIQPGSMIKNLPFSKQTDAMKLESDSNGIRVTSLDGIRSAKFSSYRKNATPIPIVVDSSRAFFLDGGNLVHAASAEIVILDTFWVLRQRPVGTSGCGVSWGSFSTDSLVYFAQSCDNGHDYIVDRLFCFDQRSQTVLPVRIRDKIGSQGIGYIESRGGLVVLVTDGSLYLVERDN